MPGLPASPPHSPTSPAEPDHGCTLCPTLTQPWWYYVLVGVCIVLACIWLYVNCRAEIESRLTWCPWCKKHGCKERGKHRR